MSTPVDSPYLARKREPCHRQPPPRFRTALLAGGITSYGFAVAAVTEDDDEE
jgi:hypothetical protein